MKTTAEAARDYAFNVISKHAGELVGSPRTLQDGIEAAFLAGVECARSGNTVAFDLYQLAADAFCTSREEAKRRMTLAAFGMREAAAFRHMNARALCIHCAADIPRVLGTHLKPDPHGGNSTQLVCTAIIAKRSEGDVPKPWTVEIDGELLRRADGAPRTFVIEPEALMWGRREAPDRSTS